MGERTVEELGERERLFCLYLAWLQNPEEAAARAGFPKRDVRRVAGELLLREDIRAELAERCRELEQGGLRQAALRGLWRLAFAPANDAVELALREGADLQRMDLFGIAQIKRLKDGLEVRFYDRLKALELLLAHGEPPGEKGVEALYQALERSAGEEGLWKGKEVDE